jgi:hypothetical protein
MFSLVSKNSIGKKSILNTTGLVYTRNFGGVASFSVSYSLLKFRYSQLGGAVSAKAGSLVLHISSDHIPGFFLPESTHSANLDFGLYVVLKQKK